MTSKESTSPFHEGEAFVQSRMGVRSTIEPWASKVVRPFMPDQHRQFYESQPFLVVAARDERGKMWSTLLTSENGQPGFVSSPTREKLNINAQLVPGDALLSGKGRRSLKEGSDLGILGIEFETKRRNRVNGRIVSIGRSDVQFQVDQSFGNCPQHITLRGWWSTKGYSDEKPKSDESREISSVGSIEKHLEHPIVKRSDRLSRTQMDMIRSFDTLFLATGYRGDGEDRRWGCDASHRGGPPGWIHVRDAKTLFLPDFSGNNYFNTIGNLQLDNRMGVTFPLFESGGMLQLTGTACVDFDEARAEAQYPGAKRIIIFTIEEVVRVPDGSFPLQWASNDADMGERLLQVTQKTKESADVTSFVLKPLPGADPNLWPFLPGQHLPISINRAKRTKEDDHLTRTYSLSGGTDWGEYRISVKRHRYGAASQYLHDNVNVGDTITSRKPAGDFFLSFDEKSEHTVVLVSAGVGLTPMLSMLHSFVQKYLSSSANSRKCVWVHGARDGDHHPLHSEVKDLAALGGTLVHTHIAYSKPMAADTDYDSVGRVDAFLLKKLVPDLGNADFYMCGPLSFMADVQSGLEGFGVDPKHIHSEAF